MNNISNTYNYNDLASLNAINTLGQEQEAEALKQVAHQFESMFISMMLKSMRDANAVFEEDNPLNSHESKFYRQMFDDQLALSMSQGEGIGIADSIYRQLKDQFEVADPNAKKATIDVPIREYQGPNPFSSLNPKLDLPQFQQKAKSFELEGEKSIQPLHESSKVIPFVRESIKSASTQDSAAFVQDKSIQEPHKQQLQKSEIQKPASTESASVHTHPVNNIQVKTTDENTGPIKKQSGFASPNEFVETLWPVAQKVGKEMGVEPKAIMAQAALETGWGKYIIHQGNGTNSHNLFGIKADHRWDGQVAKVSTLEYRQGIAQKEVAPFRVYDSYEHSLKDYAEFVQNSDRYQQAVEQGQSVKGYSEGLQNGGYATDPNYAKKIQRIANGDVLAQAIAQTNRG